MSYDLLGIGFILLILFLIYRIIRLAIHIGKKGFQRVEGFVKKAYYQKPERFPEEAFPSYQINQNEFVRIANKTAYRHPKVENVEINGSTVYIEFSSQTGLSRNHAKITFSLTGVTIGKYTITTDNCDSSLPTHIANKIQVEIRNSVGLA